MRKYFSLIILLGLILVISNPAAAASRYGTKAYGMGGAFTAIANDASAVYWNPAGLTQNDLVGMQTSLGGKVDPDDIEDIGDFIDEVENLSNNSTLSDLEEIKLPNNTTVNLNGVLALNLGKLGLAGVFDNQFSFTGSKETYTKNSQSYEVPVGEATNTLTGQGILGWGTKVIDPPVVGSLSLGVSGKYLYARKDTARTNVDTSSLDPESEVTYTEEDDTGIGADIGALATLTDTDVLNVKAGATVKNVVNTMDLETSALDRTTTLGAGVTFKFPLIEAFSTRLAADIEMPEDGDNIHRLGFEGTLGMFSLRAGTYNSDSLDEAVYTGGLGFNLPFVDFNLAVDSEDYASLSGTFNF